MPLPPNIEDIYPLSPLQQGLLFHSVLNPEGGDYAVQLTAELASWITPHQFRQALSAMTERHGVFRTGFLADAPERPLQVVYRNATVPWCELDWREMPPEAYPDRLALLLNADRSRGFVLSEAPLFRVTVMLPADGRSRVLLSFHHLLWDGWSFAQILEDLRACCESVVAGRIPQKSERRPFRDYIEWVQKQDKSLAETFWRNELAGLTGTSPLGVEMARADAGPATYGRATLELPQSDHAALVSFARRYNLTLNTLVQGAWALLIARYGGNPDVVFGATVSGRPATLAGADSILGMFLNTIPVRVVVSWDAILKTWLTALQSRQLQAREYDYCQLADIQRTVAHLGATPLFDSIVDFKNFPPAANSGSDSGNAKRSIFAGAVESREQTGYPLTLTVSLHQQIFFEADFDLSRFSPSVVTRMLGHMHALLADMPRRAGFRVDDVSLLSAAETRTIESWSAGASQILRDTSFQEEFERQVFRLPDAIAVSDSRGAWSYSELNRAANQLARYLAALGVGPEKSVAVCVERSFALLVACVAIQKLGAVYVPLDPAYPRDRLAQYVSNTDLAAIVVTAATAASAPQTLAPVVDLDRDRARIANESDTNPETGVIHPRSLAYTIFTSGSTGSPKGAMVETAGLLNHLAVMVEYFGLGPADALAQTASPCFDISVWQLLAPLIAGASVRIVGDEAALDPQSLIAFVNRGGITILQIVPALLRLLLDEEESSGTRIGPGLRWLITTGEAITPDLACRWIDRHPDVPIVNAYGPAECSDDVSLAILAREDILRSGRVSIGRPVDNCELHVLDARMRMAPVGVAGELCVGGICVGRGYLNDPAGAARSFIPHPFAERPGERLYRTGDLARWREDGSLDFLGRRDFQLKVNGARIEAGDIEAALVLHSLVDQAVVDCDGDGAKRTLVAWVVVADDGRSVSPDALSRQLRNHLRDKLPRHMVPAMFMALDALPLNSNGKIDRARLPRFDSRPSRSSGRWRSISPSEELIAGIWSLLLKVENIDPEDDFFELGGHSLLAMQMVARASWIFDRSIPLRTLFDSPTLGEFHGAVEQLRNESSETASVPLLPVARGGPLPVSMSQRLLWRLIVSHPHIALSNIPLAFRLIGALDETALRAALEDVVARHEPLRTRICAVDDTLGQYIDPPGPFDLTIADLTDYSAGEAEEIVRKVTAEEARWPFNPIQEPAMRGVLLKLGPQECVLLITANHLLADDTSCGLLLADLAQAYDARKNGLPSPLAPLPLQFADYVSWLEHWLSSPESAQQEAFWRRKLHEPLVPLDLPASRPRGEVLTSRFRRIRRRVPDGLRTRLQQAAKTSCSTVFVIMLSVFKLLLSRRTGHRDIRVGTLMTIRHRPEMQQLIGPLVGTTILRTDLSGNPRFSELVVRVQQTLVEAFANCDLPLDRILAAAVPNRDLRRNPLFQAFIIFQQPADDRWQLGELQTIPVSAQGTAADETEITSYELIVEIEARASTLDIVFRYNADLFDDSLMELYMNDFESLLAAGSADPRLRIDSIPASAFPAVSASC